MKKTEYQSIKRKKKVLEGLEKYDSICHSIETLKDRLISLHVKKLNLKENTFQASGTGTETVEEVENRLSNKIDHLEMLRKSFYQQFNMISTKEKIIVILILCAKKSRNDILDLFFAQITAPSKRYELAKQYLHNEFLFHLIDSKMEFEQLEIVSFTTLDRIFHSGLKTFEERVDFLNTWYSDDIGNVTTSYSAYTQVYDRQTIK